MSDVKDILNLPKAAGATPTRGAGSKPKAVRPEGVSREVFALTQDLQEYLGPQAAPPPVVPAVKPAFKEKRKIGKRKVTPWVWRKFKNSARTDGLMLSHWTRAAEPENVDYSFAKYNRHNKLERYSDDEYREFLKDKNWSREETDHLWQLCKEYDLRWFVIYDRFKFPNKTLDDMKERFYKITKQLIELHCEDDDINKNPFYTFNFNKGHELERKRQLEFMDSRSRELIKEEEELMVELKRIEGQKKKGTKKAQKASADGISPTPKKKRSALLREDSLALESVSPPIPGTPLTPIPLSASGTLPTKKRVVSGPSLRSTKMWAPLPVSTRTQKRVDSALDELGVGRHPLATEKVAEAFDSLRQDLVALFDLQSQYEKKQYDVQLLRAQCDASGALKQRKRPIVGSPTEQPKKKKRPGEP